MGAGRKAKRSAPQFDMGDFVGFCMEELLKFPPENEAQVNMRINWAYSDYMRKLLGGKGQKMNVVNPAFSISEGATPTLQGDDCAHTVDESANQEEEIASSSEAQRILNMLPERTREAAVLYAEGYTMDEIAAMLGVSKATISRRLKEARERLHGRLD